MALLTPDEVAQKLGVSTNYLAKLRVSGKGPPFERLSARVIRYDADELDAWRASRRRTSTSEEGGRKVDPRELARFAMEVDQQFDQRAERTLRSLRLSDADRAYNEVMRQGIEALKRHGH